MAPFLTQPGSEAIDPSSRSRSFWLSAFPWAILYTCFVIYGSLLPFEYRPMPLGEAWERFRHIPYLSLSPGSRADLVANGVLYFFLGVLWAAICQRHDRLPIIRLWLACCALAVAVEFIQIFFSPRTVSQNDLMAEAIGAAAGIFAWRFGSSVPSHIIRRISAGGENAFRGVLLVYLAGYIFLSFFPFDFTLSGTELSAKLQSKHTSLFWAEDCENLFRCGAKLMAESLAILPLGCLLALGREPIVRGGVVAAIVCGGLIGITIEVIQLFILSGVSQGVSVVNRAFGVAAGYVFVKSAQKHSVYWIQSLKRLVLLSVPLYGLALLTLNGWLGGSWLSISEGLERLPRISFLPFYYHYFTTEQAAMVSLLSRIAMYGPIGIGTAAWNIGREHGSYFCRASPVRAGLWALVVAAVLEGGRLFIAEAKPDPTNVLIAAFAAGFTCAGLSWTFRLWVKPQSQGRAIRNLGGL